MDHVKSMSPKLSVIVTGVLIYLTYIVHFRALIMCLSNHQVTEYLHELYQNIWKHPLTLNCNVCMISFS